MSLTIELLASLNEAASRAYADGADTDGNVPPEADSPLDWSLRETRRLTEGNLPLTPDDERRLAMALEVIVANNLHVAAELREVFTKAHTAFALQRRAWQIADVPFAERDEAYWGGYVHSPISESLEAYLKAAFLAGRGARGYRGTPLRVAYEVLRKTDFDAMEVAGRFAENPQAVRLMVQWRAELCRARELLEGLLLRRGALKSDEKDQLRNALAIAPHVFELSGDGPTAEIMKGVLAALAKSDAAGRPTGFVLVNPDDRPAGKAPDSDVDAEAERQGFTRSPGSASLEEYLDAAVPPRSGGGGADNEAEDTPGEEVWGDADAVETVSEAESGILPETGGLAGAGPALGVGSGLLGAGSAAFAATPVPGGVAALARGIK